MMSAPSHLIIAPILIPLLAGALLLFFEDRERRLKDAVSILTSAALVVVAAVLLFRTGADGGRIFVYLLGNWPSPIAINLVLDRLSAMMLLLTAVLALPALVFSIARWQRAGAHFHSLFLFLLVGLNGAFLTGDLFNLFVFFEVLLAASYGLMLHGSGQLRVRAGMHYIVINLAASLLFLIGVAMIYSVTGTLNMAHLAIVLQGLEGESRFMAEAGAGILGIAFLVKAGSWPLNFWLPTAYSAAAAPVAAIFAILTKVGVYVLLRLSLLLFGSEAASTGFGEQALFFVGMATILFGAIGILASQALGRLAGYSVLVSSGTLLAAVGFAQTGVTAGALFYLISSTLTLSAFFMLIELIARGQDPAADVLAVTMEAYGEGEEEEEEAEEVGVTIPETLAVLGVSFAACGILLAGLPPLSGFVAKFAMLTSMFNPDGVGEGVIRHSSWWLASFLILSGFATLIAMTRAGISAFWARIDGEVPRVLLVEMAPVAALLAMTVFLTIGAGPVMRFLEAAAADLHSPQAYIQSVMEAVQAVPHAREVLP
jgi:Formate hydrogenlyase subunit 3/Multisubunit Na+/H+ antiporter, MnhD subunit